MPAQLKHRTKRKLNTEQLIELAPDLMVTLELTTIIL
jgi:ABC-type hemin transport system substrate-binding protein